jgi:beta-phosphoglucomutase
MPKPDPEIYLRAAALCGARLQDCAGLDDSQAGIDALRAAGIFAVAVGKDLIGADLSFGDIGSIDPGAIEAAFKAAS